MLQHLLDELNQRLTSRAKLDFDYQDADLARQLSHHFEHIATDLMAEVPSRKNQWFDGVVGLQAKLRKSRQLEFSGEMWVGQGSQQWKEEFRARVTDKRLTQQGIEIILWVGEERVEGELTE